MTGRAAGPYSSSYFRNVPIVVGIILVTLFVYSIVAGMFAPRSGVDVFTDPKYHDARMLFNASGKKQLFKD